MPRRVLLLFVGNLFTLLFLDLKLVLVCGDYLSIGHSSIVTLLRLIMSLYHARSQSIFIDEGCGISI